VATQGGTAPGSSGRPGGTGAGTVARTGQAAARAPADRLPLPQSLPWLLARPQNQAWIVRDLPNGTMVAHKSGQMPSLRHEAAIVYTRSGPFVVVGLTDNLADQDDAEDLLSRLAYQAYRYFAG
jgi:beta-lactamase class A